MNDYISREALVTMTEKELQEIKDEAYDLGYQSCLNYKGLKWTEAEELQRYRETNKAHAADVVEVVRCKDCKHHHSEECPMCHEEYYYDEDDGDGYCLDDNAIDPNAFCSYGERRMKMRLIDADRYKYILKGWLGDFDNSIYDEVANAEARVIDDCICQLDEAPTIEAEPVIRCRDCKHGRLDDCFDTWQCVKDADYDEGTNMYVGFSSWHDANFYCADGERKDGKSLLYADVEEIIDATD